MSEPLAPLSVHYSPHHPPPHNPSEVPAVLSVRHCVTKNLPPDEMGF